MIPHHREAKVQQKTETSTSNVLPTLVSETPLVVPSTQDIPVKRYYGRRKSNESTSSLSASSGDEKRKKGSNYESP